MDSVIYHRGKVVAPTEDGMEGLGLSIRDLAAYFYANDGLVASTRPERLQRSFNALAGLFDRVRLSNNTRKMVSIVRHPYHAPYRMSSEDYERRTTRIGPIFQEPQWRRMDFPECGVQVATGSQLTQTHIQHGLGQRHRRGAPPPPSSREAQTYRVSFLKRLLWLRCAVEGCLGGA